MDSWQSFIVIFKKNLKKKPVDGDTKTLLMNFHFYATNVCWNNGRATLEYQYQTGLQLCSWDAVGEKLLLMNTDGEDLMQLHDKKSELFL